MVATKFNKVAQTVGPAGADFKSASDSALKDSSFPTPSPLIKGAHSRVDIGAISQFSKVFAKRENTDPEPLSNLIETMCQARAATVEQHLGLALRPVHIVISTDAPNSLEARSSATGTSYVVSLGSDILNRLNDATLDLSAYLLDNFIWHRTGMLTEGLSMSDIVTVDEFVDLAPRLHPQNQSRDNFLSLGGAEKSLLELQLQSLGALEYLRSPTVPPNIKHQILTHNGSMVLPAFREVTHAEAIAEYRTGNVYLQALHYDLFRAVISYILAHEFGHLIQLEKKLTLSPTAAELDADRVAASLIIKLDDVDPRSLIIAMAEFTDEVQTQKIDDPNHPFTPERLKVLYQALNDTQPDLFIDIDMGERLLRFPVAVANGSNLKSAYAIFGLTHTIRIEVAFQDEGSLPAFSGVRLDLEFYDLANPDRLRSRAKFSGEVGLIDITDSIASIKGKVHDTKRRAALEIPIPPDSWAECLDCGLRLANAQILPTAPSTGWDLPHRSVEEMLGSVLQAPHRNSFSLVLLARGLFLAGRLADSGVAYEQLAKSDGPIMAPSDFVRWAMSVREITPSRSAEILNLALARYPQTSNLAYLAGIENERTNRTIQAIDAYFHEQYAIPQSGVVKEATKRFMKLLADSLPSTPESQYFEAYKRYLVAQQMDLSFKHNIQEAVLLYKEASRLFRGVADSTNSFSACLYQAETSMYAAMLSKDSLQQARSLFLSLIDRDPYFLPSFAHLFEISACEQKYDEAKDWIIKAISKDPFEVHNLIRGPLTMIDQKRLKEVCEF